MVSVDLSRTGLEGTERQQMRHAFCQSHLPNHELALEGEVQSPAGDHYEVSGLW